MLFKRYERHTPVNFTQRKAAAFARKQKREQDSMPLFADQIAQEQVGWDDEKQRREERWVKSVQRMRDLQAKHWRRVRQAYYALDQVTRARCREYMAQWRGGYTPTNMIYVIEGFSGAREEREKRLREEDRQLRVQILRQLDAQMEQSPLQLA
ncbi:hypothetical protein APB26_32545 [Pseudomonas aeruginosa]|uniref:hypothetical protein n=1 Tax=Pseudomonas aeruginosa TaxID=287 RepID=UPI00071C0D04|nr:hypothetical protein [Pseudomonas aeruginosa]KSQ21712.1 hypothetical protein APB26_32545 [Pseudomonas aeruginosa]RPV61384.1 hypothetical protein IPC838_18880 [Pseudomonas aeruginosa]